MINMIITHLPEKTLKENKKGILVSIDSHAKLDVLISLIQDHNSAGKLPRANYLIGTK